VSYSREWDIFLSKIDNALFKCFVVICFVQNIRVQNIQVHPRDGLKETLNQMNYLEKLSFENPQFVKFVYQNFYSNCAACIPGKIWKYIKQNFTYIEDEYDETITAPYVLLDTKKGDCDDFALFAKTCLDILGGWYTNYLLLGRNLNEFTHIVTFAHRGKMLLNYNDPVIIDGANDEFNKISNQYRYRKIV
jgi:hypothetical protein